MIRRHMIVECQTAHTHSLMLLCAKEAAATASTAPAEASRRSPGRVAAFWIGGLIDAGAEVVSLLGGAFAGGRVSVGGVPELLEEEV